MTVWTRVIGASARAATCKNHEPVATMMPIVHQRFEKRAAVDRRG